MTHNSPDPYLEAYEVHEGAPELVPASSSRAWMDKFADRHPYRCLPLTMANSTGWEMLCPYQIDVSWNGGKEIKDLKVTSKEVKDPTHFARSHFSSGIVTFHTGYIFRTPPGWAVWCGGAPNWPKHGVSPLSGLIETDWLPFPFTMNWQMTKAGTVRFEKGEPFCFITLSEHRRIEAVEPKIKSLAATPKLKADYDSWNESRSDFLKRLNLGEKQARDEGWQRNYMKGENQQGTKVSADHQTKRRMKKPKDLRGNALFVKK